MPPRPSKLLEINLISAHDLPPVSKTLRTFAVAYVNPDQKLTTKTDHRGGTSPSWGYKMLFHVDRNFHKRESSALTVEIYNLAWLRDLPIGTARLQLNTLSPPLTENSGYRRLSLQIRQPSGHLKGTVNLGIQLVDMDDDISLSSLRISDEEESVASNSGRTQKKPGPEISDKKTVAFTNEITDEKSVAILENSDGNPGRAEKKPGPEIYDSSVSSTPESKYTSGPESESETRTVTSGGGSVFSAMKPLPSEVAARLKRGIYDDGAGEYGSEVFENWTEGGDRSDVGGLPENVDWTSAAAKEEKEKELIPLTSELAIDYGQKRGNGLFKCFSNMHAFEFTFVCGANEFRLKKKMKSLSKLRHKSHSDGNLGRFYSS